MPKMKITVPPLDRESRSTGDLMTSFILLSKGKGAKCQLASPTRATIEGDKETLLEILDELEDASFSPIVKDVVITMEFDWGDDKSLTQREVRLLEGKATEKTESQAHKGKTKTDKKNLHDMVLKRLGRYAEKKN